MQLFSQSQTGFTPQFSLYLSVFCKSEIAAFSNRSGDLLSRNFVDRAFTPNRLLETRHTWPPDSGNCSRLQRQLLLTGRAGLFSAAHRNGMREWTRWTHCVRIPVVAWRYTVIYQVDPLGPVIFDKGDPSVHYRLISSWTRKWWTFEEVFRVCALN